jgi:acyl carrier protein
MNKEVFNSILMGQIIKIVKDVTQNPNIDENSEYLRDTGWDSLNYLTIALSIEEKFELPVSTENIDQFKSIKSILSTVSQYKKI